MPFDWHDSIVFDGTFNYQALSGYQGAGCVVFHPLPF